MTVVAAARSRLSFERAEGLVLDPVSANRGTARSALTMLGFRHLAALGSTEDAATVLQQRIIDFLLVDVTQETSKMCAFVRKIREGDIGRNAFLHIVLMTWKFDGGIVEQALNCGADDLVTRPFSVDVLGARLRAQVEARKPFVVTSDYAGPDRRKNRSQKSEIPLIEAPNLLLAKGLAQQWTERSAKASEDEIKAANARMDAERVVRAAFQCSLLVFSLRDALAAGASLDADFAKLETTAKELDRRARAPEVSKLVAALCEDVLGAKAGGDTAALARIGETTSALIEKASPGKTRDELLGNVAAAYSAMKARGSKVQKIA